MSTETDRQEADLLSANADSPKRTVRLRWWPAVIIALAHVITAYGFALFASTNIQTVIALFGVPLFSLVFMLVWWIAASRVSWWDRLLGLGVFAAAVALLLFTQKNLMMGGLLLAYALPALTIGLPAVLVLTFWMPWGMHRWIAVAFMAGWVAVYITMRADTMGGDLAPVVSWRWEPTAEGFSAALTVPEVRGKATLPSAAPSPEDWPSFRGPVRDGRRTGMSFSTDWGTPPRELWRIPVGPAWSSFVVVGEYLFTQEQRGEEEMVTCYSAATGAMVWYTGVQARYEDSMGLGPRATPEYFDGKLFTMGATGILLSLDASTGDLLWQRDVTKDAETGTPTWGFSGSPLIVGNYVIVFSGGREGKSVIAYNHANGEVAWRAGRGTSVYASPHLAELCGVSQLLMVCDFGIQSFVPETGAVLWEDAWHVDNNPRCVQPITLNGNKVMYGATGTLGSRLLTLTKSESGWAVEKTWQTKKFRPYFNNAVLHKGFCYGYDGERLACIDMATGDRRWTGDLFGGQLLLFPDMDMLLLLTEDGELVLVPATPDGFNEKARFEAIHGKTWNHPVAARGKLYLRNAAEAVCFELPAAQ